MNQNLLIVGVDPGTTVACAVLGINGKLLSSFSSKELNLNALISKLVQIGHVLVVGTDKNPAPYFVRKISTKLGARLIVPKQDMLQTEKRALLNGISLRNGHEEDAYASALFAFNEIRPVLAKINRFVDENKKQKIRSEIIRLVLLKGASIRRAAEIIEKQAEKEAREDSIIKDVVEKKELKQDDYLFLYDKLKRMEFENKLLRKKCAKLEDSIDRLVGQKQALENKIGSITTDKKAKELVRLKEHRVKAVYSSLETERAESEKLKKKINELFRFISNIGSHVLLKKLDNLGWNEYLKKKNLLNISEGDVLLVDDPAIYSDKTIEGLKGKITYIFYKERIPGGMEKTKFIFIKQEKFPYENEYFALINKKELDKIIDGKVLMEKIIEEYKEKRSSMIT